jgi:hypothetical protein
MQTGSETYRNILKGSDDDDDDDDDVNTPNWGSYVLCPMSGILKTREHSIPETGSVSVPR